MTQTQIRNSVLVVLIQILIIGLSVILAYDFTRSHDIIPKAVLRLPDVYVSHSDLWSIVTIFVITYLIQIVLGLVLLKSHAFESAKRFSDEYLLYLFAYTTASMYLFLATTINYDPQLVAAIGLFSTLIYVPVYIIKSVIFGGKIVSSLTGTIGALFSRLFTIAGALALIYFVLPLAMGKAFTADRDIANVITQIRIFFNPVGTSEWGFKNKLPGVVFEQPVLVSQSAGDPDSIYVLERVGRVYKVSLGADSEPELVLDIRANLGVVEVENGAVGLAFHPKYDHPTDAVKYVYLYYTDTRPEGSQLNKVSRFDFSVNDLTARANSEETVLEMVRAPDGFHNGGAIEFGPDGFLYIGLGEGVHPPEVKLSSEVLRAGILRIDVDMDEQKSTPPSIPFTHGKAANYWVPKDNPFIDNPQIMDEYWALGFRNPFRFNFDLETGQLWLGDVGSTIWEEVNLVEKGKHYQFPHIEGRNQTGVKPWEDLGTPEQGPVYTYEHNAYDRAVIGGIVTRSERYPSLSGKYVFADNYSAKLFVIPSDQTQVEEAELIARANQYAQRGISSVTQIESGEILVTTLGAASEPSGEVLVLVRADDADVVEVEEKVASAPADYDDEATAAMFAVNCARCHGIKGDGLGPDSKLLGVELPDFTSPLYTHNRSEQQIKDVIVKGGAQTGMSPLMPPWGEFLQPNEIDHLVEYIKTLPDKHHSH